jgi:hypothetical protein
MIRLFERPRCGSIVALMSVCLASVATQQAARGQLISLGSSYNVSGTNFVTSYGPQAVTLDQTPKLVDGGLVRLTETITPTPADGGEWLLLKFQTVSGGPLAANQNSTFDFAINHLLMNQPALEDQIFFYWNVNGAAVNPLFPFGGINRVAPNPIDASLGPTYDFLVSPPFGPASQFDYTSLAFVSPYSFVSAGGINPNTANGFTYGAHFTPVPEPGSMALVGLGGMGLVANLWRRRSKGRMVVAEVRG